MTTLSTVTAISLAAGRKVPGRATRAVTRGLGDVVVSPRGIGGVWFWVMLYRLYNIVPRWDQLNRAIDGTLRVAVCDGFGDLSIRFCLSLLIDLLFEGRYNVSRFHSWAKSYLLYICLDFSGVGGTQSNTQVATTEPR